MADWAKIPASALGIVKSINKWLLEILETDNQFLESIQVRFWAMIRELREGGRRLEVTCFFEELPLALAGVGKIVSKESATLEGYNSFSIHANHRDMVRFGSVGDNGFKRLLGELIRWESQIRDSAASQLTRSIDGQVGQVAKVVGGLDNAGSSPFNQYSPGTQFNSIGGPQNNSSGSGPQFPGANFGGPVHLS